MGSGASKKNDDHVNVTECEQSDAVLQQCCDQFAAEMLKLVPLRMEETEQESVRSEISCAARAVYDSYNVLQRADSQPDTIPRNPDQHTYTSRSMEMLTKLCDDVHHPNEAMKEVLHQLRQTQKTTEDNDATNSVVSQANLISSSYKLLQALAFCAIPKEDDERHKDFLTSLWEKGANNFQEHCLVRIWMCAYNQTMKDVATEKKLYVSDHLPYTIIHKFHDMDVKITSYNVLADALCEISEGTSARTNGNLSGLASYPPDEVEQRGAHLVNFVVQQADEGAHLVCLQEVSKKAYDSLCQAGKERGWQLSEWCPKHTVQSTIALRFYLTVLRERKTLAPETVEAACKELDQVDSKETEWDKFDSWEKGSLPKGIEKFLVSTPSPWGNVTIITNPELASMAKHLEKKNLSDGSPCCTTELQRGNEKVTIRNVHLHLLGGSIPFPTDKEMSQVTEHTTIGNVRQLGYNLLTDVNRRMKEALCLSSENGARYNVLVVGDTNVDCGTPLRDSSSVFTEKDYVKLCERGKESEFHAYCVLATGITSGNARSFGISQLDQSFGTLSPDHSIVQNPYTKSPEDAPKDAWYNKNALDLLTLSDAEIKRQTVELFIKRERQYRVKCMSCGGGTMYKCGNENVSASDAQSHLRALYKTQENSAKMKLQGRHWS